MKNNRRISRTEIESALKSEEQNIQTALTQLRDEFSLTAEPIMRPIQAHPMTSLIAALGAGLLVGYLIGGDEDEKKANNRLEPIRSALAQDIQLRKEAGETLEQAIQHSLQQLALPARSIPDPQPKPKSTVQGLLLSLAQSALRTGVQMAISQIRSRFLDTPDPE